MYTPRNLIAGTSEEAVICSMGEMRLGSSELKLLLLIKILILISSGGIELEKRKQIWFWQDVKTVYVGRKNK